MSENQKPECQLTGIDGNIFIIVGTVIKALKDAGFTDQADEFSKKAFQQESYDAVLRLCFEYVDVK